jgi:hypothetical protein
MGTRFWQAVCDEHGIGGSGKYSGVSDSHFGRINVLYHEALGGKYAPRAVLFYLESGAICAVNPKLPLGELFSPGSLVTIRTIFWEMVCDEHGIASGSHPRLRSQTVDRPKVLCLGRK